MNKRGFGLALLAITICVGFVITLSQGQGEKSLSDEITRLINQFRDSSPDRRSEAFYRLIERGFGGDLQGRTDQIPFALSRLFAALPDKSNEIKVALIELLEKENSFVQENDREFRVTGKTKLTEEYLSFYGDLIAAVSALRDTRSVNSLVGSIATGNMATRGLAALGPNALDTVIEQLDSDEVRIRSSAVRVLAHMLSPENSGKVSDPAFRKKIKQGLIRGTQDENFNTRLSAVKGLEKLAQLGEPDVIPILEQLAQGDTYKVSRPGGNDSSYPVRDAANKSLKLLRDAQKKR